MRITTALLCIVLLGGVALSAQTSHKPAIVAQQQQANIQIPAGAGGAPPPQSGTITLDQLQKRLDDLKKGLDQAQANVHAYQGAIAETENWIKQLQGQSTPKQ